MKQKSLISWIILIDQYFLMKWRHLLSLCMSFLLTFGVMAQVNTGGTHNTNNHNKQVIGYITNWDAWKAASAGLPAQGALNHLNIDYSKYTILNFSFFGVAVDGSMHSGDHRNKQIYQQGSVQQPAALLFGDHYSSWDFDLLFGEVERFTWINDQAKARAEAFGFVVNGNQWSHPKWRINSADYPGNPPLVLPKEGGAPGLLELARRNGVKVMASIGGWSMSKHFPEMAADPVKRARFIEDCRTLIEMGFDGIDLDWEYPGAAGMNFTGTQPDFANFTILAQEIRNAIGPGKLLTTVMPANPASLVGYEWSRISQLFDYFNVMTYDYNGGWSDKAGHNSPIYAYDGAEVPDFNWQSTLDAIKSYGVPSAKINMGMPFYGRGVITNGSAAVNAPTVKRRETIQPDGPIQTCADYTNWARDVYDGTPNHFFIKQRTGPGSGWTEHWDDQAKVPYKTKGNYFLSYDNERSIGIKAQYINDNQLAGTIIWQVFGDLEFSGSPQSFGVKLKRWSSVRSPLVNKINEVFATGGGGGGGNQSPSVSITSPQQGANFTAGANITIAATANDRDGSVTRVEFYQGNTLLGTDGTAPYSFTWNNVTTGNYTLTARAIDNEGGIGNASVSITVGSGGGPDPGPGPDPGTCTAPAWEPGRGYSGGSVVSYQGREYKAKWWSNQNPAQSIEWEDLGPCNGGGPDPGPGPDPGTCTAPAWEPGRGYSGGSVVSYQGREYRAKWWSNQNPAQSIEWEDLGPCAGGGGGGGSNNLPQVSLTAPQPGSTFTPGSSVTISASASDSDGTITKVEFFNGNTKLGEDLNAPYSFAWTNVPTGNYSLTARATDNSNGVGTSSSVNITVGDAGCNANGFKVVGYMPFWAGSANSIDYDKVTHIMYAFALPRSNGTLEPIPNAGKLQQIVSLAHQKGVKVLIAVGGWDIGDGGGNDSRFTQLASSPTTRTAFVNNLVNLVNQYNLDGVDMDWEYPREGNEPRNFELLMEELGQAMRSRGKLLTAAVVALGWTADGVLSGVFDDVDFLNLMAYDGGNPHSPYSYAEQSLNYWVGRGLPRSKAIIGVPFYGRNGGQFITYRDLLAQGASPNSDSFNGFSYNGIPTIKAKTELALQNAGGIMIWELSQDTSNPQTSLLVAINQVTGDLCSSPGGGGSNAAPTASITSPSNGGIFTEGDNITITATASDSDGSVAKVEFYNGTVKLGEDTSAPYSYTWTNVAAGNYSLVARALDNENAVGSSASIGINVNPQSGGGGGSGSCNAPQYVENGGYQGGSRVQNVGSLYECRPFPNSGWCNGAAWAYAPGTGNHWEDAWVLIGPCNDNPGNGAPSVSITQPANGSSVQVGQLVNITATANDSDGTISKVEFFVNGGKIGEDLSSPYTISWTAVQGNQTLTAKAKDNLGATGTSSPVTISVGSTTPPPGGPGGDLPGKILVGYWHNFNNGSSIPKLREVSDKWDVINVSFAIPTVLGGSTITFAPDPGIYPSVQEFKNDVALLQSRGKKVLISVGGATGVVDISSPADAQAFSSTVSNIIREYGFDGLDINFEGSSLSLIGGDTDFRNPTSPKLVHAIQGCRTILGQFGSDFILSMAPETLYVQGALSGYGGSAGAYLPLIYALRNDLDYIHVQHYNTGSMLGLDLQAYSQGNADFQVAMAEVLLQGFTVNGNTFPALRPDQVVIGLPASPNRTAAPAGGYTSPAEVHRALDYLIKGQSFGGRYQLRNPSGYPGFRGLMTWSINWDVTTGGSGFSTPHRAYFDALPGTRMAEGSNPTAADVLMNDPASLIEKDLASKVKVYPNPFIEKLNIIFELEKARTVSLSIVNQAGHEVERILNNRPLEAGTHTLQWDVPHLPSGFYYYRIISGDQVQNFKLFKR